MILRPCITCGIPTEASRCEEHTLITARAPKSAPDVRGYDQAWRNLSKRARRLQPFCSDCGAVEDLQADHTPEAWARKEAGKSIRLQDIDVVCGPCNRDRGAARGEGRRPDRRPTQRLKAKFPSHTPGGYPSAENDASGALLLGRDVVDVRPMAGGIGAPRVVRVLGDEPAVLDAVARPVLVVVESGLAAGNGEDLEVAHALSLP